MNALDFVDRRKVDRAEIRCPVAVPPFASTPKLPWEDEASGDKGFFQTLMSWFRDVWMAGVPDDEFLWSRLRTRRMQL